MAQVHFMDRQYTEAERINRELISLRRQVLGEELPQRLMTAGGLVQSGRVAHAQGSTRRRSGSSGRCLVRTGGYSATSVARR